MSAAALLDTNILVYAFSDDPRGVVAEKLLQQQGCAVGVQGLNEFANVARRKLGMSWPEVREALDAIRSLCPAVIPLDMDTHADGIDIAERYRLAVFDALMVAAALRGKCSTLWSEDMQDGLSIEGRLTVRNPFIPTGRAPRA